MIFPTRTFIITIVGLMLSAHAVQSQTRTLGLIAHDASKAWNGYTLFAPKHYSSTYLIDNEGRLIHEWTGSRYEPGQSVYLLPSGNLLRTCMTKGPLSTGGGEGGRLEEYDWNSNLVWEYDYSTAAYMQHHDVRPLPNGNILLLAVEKKTLAECLAAGFDPTKFQADVTRAGYLVPEYVVEIMPVRPKGATVVWEWHVWDHLIQDNDATKANYGVVSEHPELIDVDGDGKNIPSFWNHANAVNYNARLDQVMISCRNNSEAWVIDHSTTTAEATGHKGGKRGRGGDLLYRWGNPTCYKLGTTRDQLLYQQHDTQWIEEGCPGAGNMICFNNGLGRNYSTADEWTPPVDADGNYTRVAGKPFGPTALTWTFKASPPSSMFAEAISGVQRLPNGNTLIDDGVHGTFLEVTTTGEVVWKYICPVETTGPLHQGDTTSNDPARAGEKMNAVFRVTRYPLDYAGLAGRDLTPGAPVELYLTGVDDGPTVAEGLSLQQNHPNPFNPGTRVTFTMSSARSVRLTVEDGLGRIVAVLADGMHTAGEHTVSWNAQGLPSGMYTIRLGSGTLVCTRRAVVLK